MYIYINKTHEVFIAFIGYCECMFVKTDFLLRYFFSLAPTMDGFYRLYTYVRNVPGSTILKALAKRPTGLHNEPWIKRLHDYCRQYRSSVDVVVCIGYPVDPKTFKIDVDKKVCVTFVGQEYTIFKNYDDWERSIDKNTDDLVQDEYVWGMDAEEKNVVEEENHIDSYVLRKVPSRDAYDFEKRDYKSTKMIKETYFDTRLANNQIVDMVDEDIRSYNNKKSFTDEFIIDMMENNEENRKTCKIIDFDFIKKHNALRGGEFIFANPKLIDEEYVVFAKGEEIPCFAETDELFRSYEENHVNINIDIETITVDKNKKKIPDQIVSISLIVQKGNKIQDIVLLTTGTEIKRAPKTVVKKMRGDENNLAYKFYMNKYKKYWKKHIDAKFKNFPNVRFLRCQNEKEMMLRLLEEYQHYKPDIMVGYNLEQFDIPMEIRACVNYDIDYVRETSCLNVDNSTSIDQTITTKNAKKLKGTSGLIKKKDLDLTPNISPGCVISDLLNIHKTRLDTVCKKEMKLGKYDMPYDTIAETYWGGDCDELYYYQVIDSLLTTMLYDSKDKFAAFQYYHLCQEMAKTALPDCFTGQKTLVARTTMYMAYRKKGFVEPATIKPKRMLYKKIFKDVAMGLVCEEGNTSKIVTKEALQIIYDYELGKWKMSTIKKCKTAMDSLEANSSHYDYLRKQLSCVGSSYTSPHLLQYLEKIMYGRAFVPIQEYADLVEEYIGQNTNKKSVADKMRTKLNEFWEWLTKRQFSPYEPISDMVARFSASGKISATVLDILDMFKSMLSDINDDNKFSENCLSLLQKSRKANPPTKIKASQFFSFFKRMYEIVTGVGEYVSVRGCVRI